jgi:hypothetical protein
MKRRTISVACGAVMLVTPLVVIRSSAGGEQPSRTGHAPGSAAPPAPIRATMSQLHAHGGVPPGWKFLLVLRQNPVRSLDRPP